MSYYSKIKSFNKENKLKIVVIDDDPTGCQTIHSVPVLTSWENELIKSTINSNDIFFILTNSRSVTAKEAGELNREIAKIILDVFSEPEKLRIISRSDSTLRGHLYSETRALIDTLGPFDGIIIAPFFAEGGRITFNDNHYLKHEMRFIPVSETEYAKDPVFGFTSSNLPEWLESKSDGYWKKEDVISISIHDIRSGGPERVASKLMGATLNQAIILNAKNDQDLECAVWGICLAEEQGKRFLYRTAASFVRARGGIYKKKLTQPKNKVQSVLIVAGSFTEKTTQQLKYLCDNCTITTIEIHIHRIFEEGDLYRQEIGRLIEKELSAKKSILLFTERNYQSAGSDDETQSMGKHISNFLSGIVSNLTIHPEAIISKGGITSHDVAKYGLGIKKATVLGQIEPGIPILKLSSQSKSPGTYYIIFPGNVGETDSLYKIVKKLLIS